MNQFLEKFKLEIIYKINIRIELNKLCNIKNKKKNSYIQFKQYLMIQNKNLCFYLKDGN